jgi:hypothetical protein
MHACPHKRHEVVYVMNIKVERLELVEEPRQKKRIDRSDIGRPPRRNLLLKLGHPQVDVGAQILHLELDVRMPSCPGLNARAVPLLDRSCGRMR